MTLGLPDEPRWVEAHGIAADPTSWRRAVGGGFALGHDRAKLVVIAGDAEAAATIALAREYPAHTLLVASDDLAAALRGSGRAVVRAILHTLADAVPDLEGATLLPEGTSLAHLPAALAAELAAARAPIFAAFVDGQAVAFAYAPWRSARFFDVSVDTIASARQLGLGALVAAAMIRHERAAGREPVWGADEGNTASLRLAKRLGFTAMDEIWVVTPQM